MALPLSKSIGDLQGLDKRTPSSPQERPYPHYVSVSPRAERRPSAWQRRKSGGLRNVVDARQAASKILQDDEVIELAQKAFEKAHDGARRRPANPELAEQDANQGITIDLSHSAIASLPIETFDIINHDLERLALSHNYLTTLPRRISDCTSLRYLNIRRNSIEVFPDVLSELPSLEILDLSQNKLKALPEGISKMESLKVLAVRKNSIQELPLCIGDMGLLQVLKIDDNPLNPALQAILDLPPTVSESFADREATEFAVTTRLKRFLRRAKSVRTQTWGRVHRDNANTQQIRHNPQRSRTGRFPIRVHGSDGQLSRQQRVVSGAIDAPAWSHGPASPVNLERTGLASATRSERSQTLPETPQPNTQRATGLRSPKNGDSSNKRFGMQRRPPLARHDIVNHLRGSSLGTVLSTEAVLPHFRTQEPTGQEDTLRILQIWSPAGHAFDRALGVAQALYLSIHQLHWLVKALSPLFEDIPNQHFDLSRVISHTNFYVNQLGQHIQQQVAYIDQKRPDKVDLGETKFSCTALVHAYRSICHHIAQNVDVIVDNGGMPLVRLFLNLLYGSVMVLRAELQSSRYTHGKNDEQHTVREPLRPWAKPSEDTQAEWEASRTRRDCSVSSAPLFDPATQRKLPQPSHTTSPTASTSAILPTPAESSLQQVKNVKDTVHLSCDFVLKVLPSLHAWLNDASKRAESRHSTPDVVAAWYTATNMCSKAAQQAGALDKCLSRDQKESRLEERLSRTFYDFVRAWADLGDVMRSSKHAIQIPAKFMKGLSDAQRSVKEATRVFATMDPTKSSASATPTNSETSSPLAPMTPLKASLGPAIGAVLPHEA